MSLYQKILAVQQAVETVKKNGRNDYHKYRYATEADILSAKKVFNDQGLVVLPTMTQQETGFKPDGKGWAKVTLTFRVVDVEDGECLESNFTGYAEDTFDKAIYKAITGANKYFYLKFCGMATDDDPENEKQKPSSSGDPNETDSKPAIVPRFARNRALKAANSILALQKQAKIPNSEVLQVGAISTVKGLAEAGEYSTLEAAYQRLKTAYPTAMQAAGNNRKP